MLIQTEVRTVLSCRRFPAASVWIWSKHMWAEGSRIGWRPILRQRFKTLQTASSFQLPLDTEAVSTHLGGQHSCRAGRNRADAEPRGSNLWDVSQALQCCTHLYIALVCLSPEVFGFTMHGPCLAFSTGPWGSNQSSTAPGPVKEVHLKVARWRPVARPVVELPRGSRRSWSSTNHRGDGAPHLLLHGGLAAKVLVCLGTLAARGWVSHS